MPMILLLYKEVYFNTNKLDSCVLSVCVSLLHEFKDVFLDEILSGLSFTRGIEHQIDLVPGLVIPNKPTYRSNDKKTKELQKQVVELMFKRYIQENMSPCVFLVLLVHKKDGTWRMYVDCRAINKIMIKYRHHILRLDYMLDQIAWILFVFYN